LEKPSWKLIGLTTQEGLLKKGRRMEVLEGKERMDKPPPLRRMGWLVPKVGKPF